VQKSLCAYQNELRWAVWPAHPGIAKDHNREMMDKGMMMPDGKMMSHTMKLM